MNPGLLQVERAARDVLRPENKLGITKGVFRRPVKPFPPPFAGLPQPAVVDSEDAVVLRKSAYDALKEAIDALSSPETEG